MKYELQRSFASGELSELTHMRNDLGDIYDAGVSALRNMRPDPRGPAISRDGLKSTYRLGGPPQPTNCRLEVLQKANTFEVLMFIHIGLIVIRNIENPITELYSAPWTMDQLEDLYLIPLPSGKIVYILHPNVQPYKLTDNSDPVSTEIFTASGNFIVPGGITSVNICLCGAGGGGAAGSEVPAFGTNTSGGGGGGGSGVVKATVSTTPSEVIPIVIGAGGAGGASAGAAGGNGGDSTFTALIGLTTSLGGLGSVGSNGADGKSGGGDGGNGGANTYDGRDGDDSSAVCSGASTSGGIGGTSIMGAFGTNEGAGGGGGGGAGGYGDGGDGQNAGASSPPAALPNTGAGGGGGAHSTIGDSGLAGGSGFCYVTWDAGAGFNLAPVTFTSPPISWTGLNWPSAGAYFQQRLWLGGEPDNGEDFVGSVPGLPEDLTVGTAPAGAIRESIERVGRIEWMIASKKLLIGTTTGEHLISSDNKILLPGEISIELQSSYGSASIQPIQIGDQVIYTNSDLRRIYTMDYEFLKENWLSADLTFFSEHITKGLIREMAWAQYPDKTIYVVLQDGNFCSLSYERTNDTFGWSLNDTIGNVLSIASGFNGTKSIVVMALERDPGQGDLSIEYFHPDYKLDAWEEISSHVVYGDIFYITMSTNNLAGQTVQILIDGIVHPERIVGAESATGAADGSPGRIYLDFVGSNHIVGLQYIPQLISLSKMVENQDGNDFMHEKTYSEIAIKLLDSKRPIVNGKDTFERFPETPQGEPEPSKTELIIIGEEGWDQDALIDVSQPLPYKLSIAAIGGQYTAKKL